MISIIRATEKDTYSIAQIGKVSVTEAHSESCTIDVMNEYVEKNYNVDSIKSELNNKDNIYHIIKYENKAAGFSKINLNAKHDNITDENATKLDRIYLLKEYQGLKLGFELLKFNIDLSKNNNQSGIWLFTWIGNTKAIDFYNKSGFEIIGNHDFHVAKTHYNPNYQMYLNFSKSKIISS